MDMTKFQRNKSEYLKSADLGGKSRKARITRVEEQNLPWNKDDEPSEPVVFFGQNPKGLVLNATNLGTLINAYGTASEAWIGNEVVLYTVDTHMPDGTPTKGLRIMPEVAPEDLPEPSPRDITNGGADLSGENPANFEEEPPLQQEPSGPVEYDESPF